MNLLHFFLKHLQKSYTKFNPYEYEVGDVIWAKMPLSENELKFVPKGHEIRPYLIISINNEEKNYLALESTSDKGRMIPHSYKIDKNIYDLNKSPMFKYIFTKLDDKNILNYYFKVSERDKITILTEMLKDTYVNIGVLKKTDIYKNYKELFIKKGSIIKDQNNNYYLIIKTKKNSIDLFKVQIDSLDLNKHYSYRYNNYNIEFNNIISINNLDNFDIIGIIPDNIVDIVLEKNKSYDENKNKTNDINLPKKQRARIHDFIVYKNNFYVVEDKYENILICRCQNSKNKKHINYYADYKIVGADLTRKRS